MADEYLKAYFAFRDGDADNLKDQHIDAFEANDDCDVNSPFIETDIGNIEPHSTDVPGITGMSFIENYTYEGDSEDWDLLYAPMVDYYLGDLSTLKNSGQTSNTDPLEAFIECIVVGYEATDQTPLAVIVKAPPHGYYIGEAETPPFTAESLANDEYDHLSWITIFTPPMVENYGRETLLSAPAWRVEELDDGAILVACHNDVSNWPDCRDVADHIGLPWYKDIL